MSVFGLIKSKILNVAGTQVNPATEEKQDSFVTAIGTLISAVESPERIKKIATEASIFVPLLADASQETAWIDASSYSGAIISVVSDQDSAENGLIFDTSKDGVNVFHPHKHSVLANDPDGHHYPTTLECDYFRVRFTNGPIAQTVFKVHIAMFTDMPEEAHVHPLEYPVDSDHSASISRAVLLARAPNGNYNNIGCTAGLNLKTSLEEVEPGVVEEIGIYPIGTGANGSVTLTSADTAYAIPASAPAGSYKITVQNNSDTDIYVGYQNSATNGIKLEPGDSATDKLGASQQLYAYCASAGKIITYTTKLVS